ncbi:putative disease resistance protein At3g14460 isoform X2 [Lotus japonicus]|nr:putative disease resistance protein At3g14460 isoform X2 [Lotus japonicus]XP_057453691.1 putative disease resistance protein At3g14460 isoform X2 [Lotus japonicus]
MLLSINAVVDDAELKQIRNGNVKAWLDAVKDAAFDAEDLLDEIDAQLSLKNQEAESQPTASKVWNFFNATVSAFDKEIEPRMQEILDNLEYLARQKDILGLREGAGFGVGSTRQVSQKLPSTSLFGETVIYGRHHDKGTVFGWLMSDSENDDHQLSIISVVGMGGMGKTTLAQHLYNDPRLEGKFDIKAWVCVSDDFDVFKVTRAILDEITRSSDDSRELNTLQVKLKEKLMGKSFLLVLDDVWNEDHMQWESLRAPFSSAAQGSKILVTTRSMKVASIMRSNQTCQLEQLQEQHSWQLFSKHAFQDENSQLNPDFKEVGIKIVRKCKGLPLALKSIGSLLYTKSSSLEWERILKSEVWEIPEADNNIIPALILSYQYLPSHLKRCFAYCSLFPKGYVFEKEDLVLLWMAEKFLKCFQKGKSIEEVGEEYFNDLLSMSFFQHSRGDRRKFVMHDLLNDLAKYVSGDFAYRLEVEEAQNISKMIRHFSFLRSKYEASERFDALYNTNRLRTFLPLGRNANVLFRSPFWISDVLVHALVSKFKYLRALSFSGYGVFELPDSVGNLIHLRHLDLSCTLIKKLPDSICFLYNLETLKLKECQSLEELPLNLHKLTKLRYLDFSGTKVRKMPMHLEKLNNLQVLNSFYVGKGGEYNIQQLGELNLHGALSIFELQNIVNPSDALTANLKNKVHLVKLELEWSANDDDSQKGREVLEKLQPSKHLKKLSISNYGSTRFPDWFGDNSLSNVVSITLRYCVNCVSLPSFGLLPSLKKLSIIGLHGVVVIGGEFYGNGSSTIPFASLERLEFEDMKELEEWECKRVGDFFPRLEDLIVSNCPKLKEHLPKQLPSLKLLSINCCFRLVGSVPLAPSIQKLNLHNCGKLQFGHNPSTLQRLRIGGRCMKGSLLESIWHTISNNTSLVELLIVTCPNMNIPISPCYKFLVSLTIIDSYKSLRIFPLHFFPNLNSLELVRCPNLEMITQEEHGHNLTKLNILWCPKFTSFPKGGLSAPRLQNFNISGLENLRSLPESMHILLPSLDELNICDCPQLEPFSDGALPPNLQYLILGKRFMPSLIQALAANTSQLRLRFTLMDDVECFPDEGLLPHSLTSLEIYNFPNLTKLDYRGLCHLPSLTELHLFNCPGLQCFPEEGLPKSISKLSIRRNCPLLKQLCQKPNGEDWGKISHIQWIYIDDE